MIFKFGDLTINSELEPWRSEGIRIGFYSAPGTRKSYTVAACIVEPFLDEGGTVVIFQPRSEWHTLKEKWGSVIVAGGPFQDVPIVINQARVYAEAIVNNGVSMVFDFSETDERDLVKFSAELLQRIYTLQNVTRRPLLLFPEEISEYAPFRSTGKLVKPWVYDRMKSRILKIATQGRPLGFLLVGTSQRPAQLDFTVRMMCNLSFYGKFHPKDLNDIKTVLSAYKDIPAKEMAEKCVKMPHGTWIAITAEEATFTTIKSKRLTPHGADTPKLKYVAPRTEETKKAVTDLTETIQKALEKERLEESELEKEREKAKKLGEVVEAQNKEIERLQTALTVAGKIKIEPSITEGKSEEMESLRQRAYATESRLNKIKEILEEPSHPIINTIPDSKTIYEIWAPKLPHGAKRILKLLIDKKGLHLTKREIAVALGYRTTSGTFNSNIHILKRNHLIKSNGTTLWVE